MEVNGGIVAELNIFYPKHFPVRKHTYKPDNYKMCKDDIGKSFYDISGDVRKDVIMTNEYNTHDKSGGIFEKIAHSNSDFITDDDHMLSIIQKKSEDAMTDCLVPAWKSSSTLCGFERPPKSLLNKFKNSFLNGGKVSGTTKESLNTDCYSSSKSLVISDSSLDTANSLLETIDDSSSSSIEEIFCPAPNDPSEIEGKYLERHNFQGNFEHQKLNSIALDISTPKNSLLKTANQGVVVKVEKNKDEKRQKKDLKMPELIPTLVCLDDDDDDDEEDSVHSDEKSREVINVADSPEMPKLVPFSAEAEELRKINKECLNDEPPKPNSNAQLQKIEDSVQCNTVNLRSCSRKLFQDIESLNKKKSLIAKCTKLNPSPISYERSSEASSDNSKDLESELSCDLSETTSKHQTEAKRLDHKSESKVSSSESSDSDITESESESEASVIPSITTENCETAIVKNNFSRPVALKLRSEDSQTSLASRQPQVVLRRLSSGHLARHTSDKKFYLQEQSVLNKQSAQNSLCKTTFKNCLPSQNLDENVSLASNSEKMNSSSETPEIDSIEGVQFYQFPTKHAMEDFTQKAMDGKADEEVIVLTKTTDITQIKGWREKCFPQYINNDESSQNAVPGNTHFNSEDGKALNFHNCVSDGTENPTDVKEDVKDDKDSKPEDLKTTEPKKEPDIESKAENILEPESKPDATSKPESKTEVTVKPKSKTEVTEPESKPKAGLKPNTKSETNSMSAFVSQELEYFLKNSSKLNVSFLQRVNPNITPISPDATILCLGKLRKEDDLKTLESLKKRNYLMKIRKEEKMKETEEEIIDVSDVPSSPVITLSSSEDSSSDEDIPVSKLSRGTKRTVALGRPAARVVKRKKSDSSESSQRVVLRLTKQSKGAAKDYKVSEITCDSENSNTTSTSSSNSSESESESEEVIPEYFKMPDGSVPTIKETVFLKETEPKLLEEFLNNLNMYGMSKDVAMLVQSNQSYFDKGPDLTSDDCSEAVDALLTNQKFIEVKNKATPRKKLKAWQKYLPKNGPRVQSINKLGTKISQSSVTGPIDKPVAGSIEKKLRSKYGLKPLKSKTTSDIKPSVKPLNFKRKSISEGVDVIKKVKKIRKRTRSEIEMPDDISAIERGKRSIRLPARYLDSAVLAVGSEWVSPTFVDDGKNTRKKLLDVLDKMTAPNDAITDPEKVDSSPGKTTCSPARKKSLEVFKKPAKSVTKVSNIPRKNVIRISPEIKKGPFEAKTLNNQKMEVHSNLNSTPENRVYNLPPCSCTPCSRTASFSELTKEFVCLNNHNQKHAENVNLALQTKIENDCEIINKEIVEEELQTKKCLKMITDDSIKSEEPSIENKIMTDNITKNSSSPMASDKDYDSNLKQPIITNITSLTSSKQSNNLDKNKITNTEPAATQPKTSSNLFLFVNNAGQNLSIVPCQKPLKKSIKKPTVSDLRDKPPILLRKAATETPVTCNRSTASVVLKFPANPLASISGSIQTRSIFPKTIQNNTQLAMVPPISSNAANFPPILVNDKMYVCTSVLNDATTQASPVTPSPIMISSITSQSITSQPISGVNQRPLPKILLETGDANYLKPPTERRRKAPLKKRRFSEDDDDSGSEENVDIDTVDESFDALATLKGDGPVINSDASDNECSEIFSTNLANILHSKSTKTIAERNRRLEMKRMFERLKPTCTMFDTAKSCKEILDMSVYVIEKYKREQKALRCAKKMLRLYNAQLLKKLIDKITAIEDTKKRAFFKSRVIHRLSSDFKDSRPDKNQLAYNLMTQMKKKKPTSSELTSTTGVEHIETIKMDFEVNEAPAPQVQPQFSILDQPHVQLRILELPIAEVEVTEKNPHTEDRTNANNSDDDLLIIDLSEDSPTKSSKQLNPEKMKQNISVVNNECVQSKTDVPAIKKFPGLLPLFGPPIYDNLDPPPPHKPKVNIVQLETATTCSFVVPGIQTLNNVQSPTGQSFSSDKLLNVSVPHQQSVNSGHEVLPPQQNIGRLQLTNLITSTSQPLNLSITGAPKPAPEEIVIDISDDEPEDMSTEQLTTSVKQTGFSDKSGDKHL